MMVAMAAVRKRTKAPSSGPGEFPPFVTQRSIAEAELEGGGYFTTFVINFNFHENLNLTVNLELLGLIVYINESLE